MSELKVEETIWCYECNKTFKTTDYFALKECELCRSNRIYRTSGTSFVYAYQNREKREVLIDFLIHLRKNYTREMALKVVNKYMF